MICVAEAKEALKEEREMLKQKLGKNVFFSFSQSDIP
jgi:hypothetical protein